MSSNLSTHIGPYLEVIGTKEKIVIKIKRECPKHPHLKQSDSKFCKECGEVIPLIEFPETKKLTPKQVYFNSPVYKDDVFYFPQCIQNEDSFFLPNHKVPGNIDIDEEGGVVELTNASEMIKKQMEWFKTKYQKIIQFLMDEFGYTNVRVKWGIISFWS